ncbi:UNVERIFIED_CONTAM: 26S proteasome non-ATPase regulatory subunit [Sesamum latifolium]|uniref:26S proteasome non-ATPase regulatory subunit n=1 Tax=Sesamum latifolium TaxID=2727402 RepID=A0AAW2XC42_9LAMI
MNKLLADQSFVSSILTSLPGVDPNDPHVKDLLASMQSQSELSLSSVSQLVLQVSVFLKVLFIPGSLDT